MLSADVQCTHYVPVALVATLGAVKVSAVATLRVVVRRVHRFTALTTPGAVPRRAPRIHRLHANTEQFSLVFDEVEQLATRPRRNRPCHSPTRLTAIKLAQRLEDNRFTAGFDGQPDEFVRNVVLDLVAQPTFFPACLAEFGQQMVESVSVCFPLSPEFSQAVVDALGVGFQPEQFRFRRMVEKLRWSDLSLLVAVMFDWDGSDLLFDAEVDRQDSPIDSLTVGFRYGDRHSSV